MCKSPCLSSSHLSSRYELKGSQGNLQVRCVRLKVIEGLSNLCLELRRVLAGRGVRGNFVEGRHVGCCLEGWASSRCVVSSSCQFGILWVGSSSEFLEGVPQGIFCPHTTPGFWWWVVRFYGLCTSYRCPRRCESTLSIQLSIDTNKLAAS